jgi:hypothetical protein
LAEIDTIEHNSASILRAIDSATDNAIRSTDFPYKLDDFVEARNVSRRQIAGVADLIEIAFRAGRQCR